MPKQLAFRLPEKTGWLTLKFEQCTEEILGVLQPFFYHILPHDLLFVQIATGVCKAKIHRRENITAPLLTVPGFVSFQLHGFLPLDSDASDIALLPH